MNPGGTKGRDYHDSQVGSVRAVACYIVNRTPALHPIGEQDGESERHFKAKLRELFAATSAPRAAWLLRARLGNDPAERIVLALATDSDELQRKARLLFRAMFRGGEELDVVAVAPGEEAGLAAVVQPFHESAPAATRTILGKLKELFGVTGRG